MIRLLYILGVCALSAACGVFGVCVKGRNHTDLQLQQILIDPNVVERFDEDRAQRSGVVDQGVPALVAQAKAFAGLLNPPPAPKPPVETPAKASDRISIDSGPVVRPVEAAISFKLVATSYYAGRPEKSMALVAEPGAVDGGRWVKEGAQIGHFKVHEIRQGVVVLRDGDNLRELAVERAAIHRNLVVNETRPGNPQVARLDSRPVTGTTQDSNIVPSSSLPQAPNMSEGDDGQGQAWDVGL